MDVVQGGKEVAVRLHEPLDGTKPHLPTAPVILNIPLSCRPSVPSSQSVKQLFNGIGSDKQVVMVRKDAPRVEVVEQPFANTDQVLFTLRHATRTFSNDGRMVETGRGNEILTVAFPEKMGRLVPGEALPLAAPKDILPFGRSHLSPLIHEDECRFFDVLEKLKDQAKALKHLLLPNRRWVGGTSRVFSPFFSAAEALKRPLLPKASTSGGKSRGFSPSFFHFFVS